MRCEPLTGGDRAPQHNEVIWSQRTIIPDVDPDAECAKRIQVSAPAAHAANMDCPPADGPDHLGFVRGSVQLNQTTSGLVLKSCTSVLTVALLLLIVEFYWCPPPPPSDTHGLSLSVYGPGHTRMVAQGAIFGIDGPGAQPAGAETPRHADEHPG